jgi:hypothetical protein
MGSLSSRTKIMKIPIQRIATFFLLFASATHALAKWKYSSFIDPNNGAQLRLASVESIGRKGTLLVRMLPEGSVSVAFGVPATIICTNPCKIRGRLDGKDNQLRDARYPGNQMNMLYFSPQTLPFAKLRSASILEVEVETKEHGWKVLSFDTRGFSIGRLNVGN